MADISQATPYSAPTPSQVFGQYHRAMLSARNSRGPGALRKNAIAVKARSGGRNGVSSKIGRNITKTAVSSRGSGQAIDIFA